MSKHEERFPVAVTFWYRLPDWDHMAESRYVGYDAQRVLEVQRQHWDNLQAMGYELSARP